MKINTPLFKIFLCSLITLLFVSIILGLCANYEITTETDNKVFSDVNQIPYNKVGLLLGTSKILTNGRQNLYFKKRITACFELIQARKITYIVISGDNSRADYNEPQDMKDELLKLGVDSNKIYLDYAGFRTYDSMIRMNEIFGQNNFTVISQEFHNRRAVYIARQFHLNAIAYNAKDVNLYIGFKTNLREYFARVKVFIDLLFGVEAKFLGEKIMIG